MGKKILKVVIFMLIFLILLAVLSYIFIPKNNTERAGIKESGITAIYAEKENTIDLIVLGNSESFTSIIPMKLWEDCGYTSYICGKPGQVMPDTLKTLYDDTKNQKPKIVILETTVLYDDYSLTVPVSRVIQEIFPITEYHDRWKELQLSDFYSEIKYTRTDFMKGYHCRTHNEPADVTGYMDYTDEVDEINIKTKILIKIMNEYCKKNGAEFMLMSVPSPKNWNYKRHNAVKKLAEEENIEYLDFNLLTDEINIDWVKDALDGGDHINYYGSIKLTDYFEKYLKDRNVLESHKDDPEYSKWNDDLIKYKEVIKHKIDDDEYKIVYDE